MFPFIKEHECLFCHSSGAVLNFKFVVHSKNHKYKNKKTIPCFYLCIVKSFFHVDFEFCIVTLALRQMVAENLAV